MEEFGRSSPGVTHGLPAGTTVDIDDDGYLGFRIGVRRENKTAVESSAVFSSELKRFGYDRIVLGDAVCFPDFLA
jgi:hypothetical protein